MYYYKLVGGNVHRYMKYIGTRENNQTNQLESIYCSFYTNENELIVELNLFSLDEYIACNNYMVITEKRFERELNKIGFNLTNIPTLDLL